MSTVDYYDLQRLGDELRGELASVRRDLERHVDESRDSRRESASELSAILDDIRSYLDALSRRLDALEHGRPA